MDQEFKDRVKQARDFRTSFEELYNWAARTLFWPLTFGWHAAHRDDCHHHGSLRPGPVRRRGFSASPRQADLMIVSGTLTKKMAPQVVRLYNQMPEPKYLIAMGPAPSWRALSATATSAQGHRPLHSCRCSYSRLSPAPEALIHAFMALQRRSSAQQLTGESRPRHLKQELP